MRRRSISLGEMQAPEIKDYIATRCGLYCAVISADLDAGRVLTTLRYRRRKTGALQKLDARAARTYLQEHCPHWLYHSRRLDVPVHAVPVSEVDAHYRPADGLQRLLALPAPDPKQEAARRAVLLLLQAGIGAHRLGITGSLLLGAHGARSDIDLVVYGRQPFHTARSRIRSLLATDTRYRLDAASWHDAYRRRACSLSFSEYLRHEQRKHNKFMVNGSKVDVSLVPLPSERFPDPGTVKKHGGTEVVTTVIDDRYIFDLPARYYIDHDDIGEILCFTATYTGQAFAGERIAAAGQLEIDQRGEKRLLVGSSREAPGEYIRRID